MSRQQMTDETELEYLIEMVRRMKNQVDFFSQNGRLHTAGLLNDARNEIIRLGGLKPYLPVSVNDLDGMEKKEYDNWLEVVDKLIEQNEGRN